MKSWVLLLSIFSHNGLQLNTMGIGGFHDQSDCLRAAKALQQVDPAVVYKVTCEFR